jgi:hypothetical protein
MMHSEKEGVARFSAWMVALARKQPMIRFSWSRPLVCLVWSGLVCAERRFTPSQLMVFKPAPDLDSESSF